MINICIYMLKENIYSQLYYTKVLNGCKFQLTGVAGRVKQKELNTYYIDQPHTPSSPAGLVKTESDFIVRSVETGIGR